MPFFPSSALFQKNNAEQVSADSDIKYNLYLFLGCTATLMALSVFVSLCRGGILTITFFIFGSGFGTFVDPSFLPQFSRLSYLRTVYSSPEQK